jgi:hypothetical protein
MSLRMTETELQKFSPQKEVTRTLGKWSKLIYFFGNLENNQRLAII